MPSSIQEVLLRVLFSVRYLHVEETRWDFYINYVPEIGSIDLESAFGGSSDAPILLAQNPWLRNTARPLINEIRSLVPQNPPISVGGVPLSLTGGLWAFSHYIDGWSQSGPGEIEWVKDLRFPNGNAVQEGTHGKIAVADLSNGGRAALARLDSFAIVTARERFADKVSHSALFPPEVDLLPRRTKVFISYRRPQMDIARALHRFLGRYGNRAIFEPYLDVHDLELGSLRVQLKHRITEWADLFMPVVSDVYAASGSISSEELEWARQRAQSGGATSVFIAPVFVGHPRTEVAAELDDLVRGNVNTVDDVAESNEPLRNFLVACARA